MSDTESEERFVCLADVAEDNGPHLHARGWLHSASVILDRIADGTYGEDHLERAQWRILDALIHVTEALGDSSADSGLSRAHGWVFTRSGTSEVDVDTEEGLPKEETYDERS